jgi:tetratricopeptide (TPR) repeat protein
MILRLSDSLSRALVVATALLLGLWLSFFSVRAAMARYGADRETLQGATSAVRWESGNPDYWYILGRYQQYNLEQPDAKSAEQSYKRAIALNPYATDAWLDLGTAYELDGDAEKAREAYIQAQKTYPTSANVSWRYGNFLLRQGQQQQAYAELRRAIEADPHRAAAAFSRAYRSNPNIDELLTNLLPRQQSVYVDVIHEALGDQQLAVAKTVWAQLIQLHPQLEIGEVDRFVSQLLLAQDFTDARRVWDQGTATMHLPPLLQLQSSVVWDPSFETALNGYAFSWHYASLVDGISIGLDRTEKLSGNQSLCVSFDGRHDPNLDIACILSVVEPSTTYRFSGWIKPKELTSDKGIRFRLRSVDSPNAPSVVTNQVLGTQPWAFVDQTWTASPDAHRLQICVTREASTNPDERIAGSAWIDDVNLLPQAPEHRRP